jgi:hypothetical protein
MLTIQKKTRGATGMALLLSLMLLINLFNLYQLNSDFVHQRKYNYFQLVEPAAQKIKKNAGSAKIYCASIPDQSFALLASNKNLQIYEFPPCHTPSFEALSTLWHKLDAFILDASTQNPQITQHLSKFLTLNHFRHETIEKMGYRYDIYYK